VGGQGVCGPPPSWLSSTPENGILAPGTSAEVVLTFNPAGLSPGTYTHSLCIGSNDFNQPIVEVDISLTVTPAPVSGGVAYMPVVVGD